MGNEYADNGYAGRADYHRTLAAEYGAAKVYFLADILGPEEDFDALVVALEHDPDGPL